MMLMQCREVTGLLSIYGNQSFQAFIMVAVTEALILRVSSSEFPKFHEMSYLYHQFQVVSFFNTGVVG